MPRVIYGRARQMRRLERRRVAEAAACALAMLMACMPASAQQLGPGSAADMQAGIPLDPSFLSYAAVSTVAFLLGVAVTVFCRLLRKRRKEKEDRHDRDR